jgi:hypothetical protein
MRGPRHARPLLKRAIMRLFASRMRAAGYHQIIKPIGSHASIQGGFTKDDFTINLAARSVTCPAGQQVVINPSGEARFGAVAAPARCDLAARLLPVAARCWSTPGKPSSKPPAARPLILGSRPATGGGGRWWNARSPGWSLAATDGSATAGWPAISCGWPTGSRPSTCVGWSPSG